MILCANPSAQFKSYQGEIEKAVLRVIRGSRYVLGEEVKLLEQEFARYIGVNACVGVANGTDAIELALRALEIGPGDEVITVSHTAVATVAAIEASRCYTCTCGCRAIQFYTLNPTSIGRGFYTKNKSYYCGSSVWASGRSRCYYSLLPQAMEYF